MLGLPEEVGWRRGTGRAAHNRQKFRASFAWPVWYFGNREEKNHQVNPACIICRFGVAVVAFGCRREKSVEAGSVMLAKVDLLCAWQTWPFREAGTGVSGS